jgi:MFS family permease
MFATFFFASLYIQHTLGFDPLEAGLAFLPCSLSIMVGAGIAQGVIRRAGVRPVALVGMATAAVGLYIQSRISLDGHYASVMLPGLITMGVGMGLTFVPITLIATTNVSGEDAGLASGLFNTAQQVGGALGLAILSTLATDKTTSALQSGVPQPAAFVEGWQVGFTGAAVALAAAVVVLAVLVRERDVAHVNADQPVPVAA